MSRKAFLVQVELDVQAVTCPGVWLCSNGKVSLQIYMLDSCVQTASYKPTFPIQCNETFVFYKTFYSKHQLIELQKELHDQWLYMELVQWQNCEIGNVLATFQTTLDELLYPSTLNGSIAGVDLDLLMEPSKTFPGTIAPKIEVSTKTTIEETLCVCTKPASATVIVNPKVLMSSQPRTKGNFPRKVCHSVAYSRKKRPFRPAKTKPPFCYRKADDDLILRKPQYDLDGNYCNCRCRRSKSVERRNIPNIRKLIKSELPTKPKECPCTIRTCTCGSGHKENFCPVCSKYKGYFNVSPMTLSPKHSKKEDVQTQPTRTKLFEENRKCCRCRCHPSDFVTTDEKSDSAENISDVEECKKKLCFCLKQKPSLAEKLHEKLNKTLSSIPKSVEWTCYDDDYEYECDCPTSRGDLYRDLQKFYGDLYEKSRSSMVCVPDCRGLK